MKRNRKTSLLRRVVGVLRRVVGVGLMLVGFGVAEVASTHTPATQSHRDVIVRGVSIFLGLGFAYVGWRMTGWHFARRAKDEEAEVRGTATEGHVGPPPRPKPYVKRPKDTSAMCECGHISYLHHGGSGKCTGADCKCAVFRVAPLRE